MIPVLFFILFGWCGGGGVNSMSNCVFETDTNTFDVTYLSDIGREKDWEPSNVPGITYYINICRPVLTDDCGNNAASCIIWDEDLCNNTELGCASGGEWNTWKVFDIKEKQGGFRIIYTLGWEGRITQLDMLCDHDAEIGNPIVLKSIGPVVKFQWKTMYACPVESKARIMGPSFLWIFLLGYLLV